MLLVWRYLIGLGRRLTRDMIDDMQCVERVVQKELSITSGREGSSMDETSAMTGI